ncbi:YceG-like family protein [Paenibacillus polysaccharolyticus]|uniref:YceG-like family protein n=1 Tax=Paenibacillus polysaccharolyticus TaxID=582692 RepID=A0A1G5KVS4_9BACL|nr:endolytic transglycosylase MltG [Paenibacillus polysaccharolyticus]SCZ04238.1 YceG-like family protein [Paenibacillus polysaccharolyticus]
MDKRSLWIGIGSGMITGAILLQLATVGQKALSDSNLEPVQRDNWTKEQLETAAKSLDMKLVGTQDELYTEAEWVSKKKQESNQMQGKSAEKPQQTTSAAEPTEPMQPQTDQPKTNTPVTPTKPNGPAVTFKVRSGNSLVMVAENLKEAGIVDDAQAFIKAGKSQGINKKIQVGTYSLEKGESFKSIIAKITKEPSS